LEVDLDVSEESNSESEDELTEPNSGATGRQTVAKYQPVIIPKKLSRNESLEYYNLRIVQSVNRTGFQDTRDFPMSPGTLIANRSLSLSTSPFPFCLSDWIGLYFGFGLDWVGFSYEIQHPLGSAAFSHAVQCVDRHTGLQVSPILFGCLLIDCLIGLIGWLIDCVECGS
jgi:hypothetical protein